MPAGTVRIEIAKGLEYAPQTATIELTAGQERPVEITLSATAAMPPHGYFGGDPHLHFRRMTPEDDQLIFDLLDCEAPEPELCSGS